MTPRVLATHCFVLFTLLAAAAGCGKSSPTAPTTTTPPATCSYTVGGAPADALAAAGSEFTLSIATAANCGWIVSSSTAFITIAGANGGSGNGSVKVSIATNTGAVRQGSLTVADKTVTISQQAAPPTCTYTVTPASAQAPQGGGDVSFDVTAGANCAWTATASDVFITVKQGASGTGNGTVVLTAAANSGAVRSGSANIAGTTVTVNQGGTAGPTCAYTASPALVSIPASGGSSVITVTTTPGTNCPWTASSQSSFISFSGGTSGNGNGSVTLAIAANAGAARSGSVNVAGTTVTVDQSGTTGPSCSYSVSPTQVTIAATGGTTVITVTAGTNCTWTAVSQASYISVVGNAAGSGNGAVTLAIASNAGAARTGLVTVGGQTATISQLAPSNGAVAVLSYQSDPGDYIGAGQSATFVLAPGQFTATYDPSRAELRFNIPPSGGTWWNLNLQAASGQSLVPGLYSPSARWPFQPPGTPGLDFSGSGRGCNQSVGRFLIAQAVFGAGQSVDRLHVRFEQHCEGHSVALHGELWIDVNGSTTPPPLAQFPTPPATPTTFFTYQSDPGDPVGRGGSGSYTLAGMNYLAWSNPSRPAVNISFQNVGIPTTFWHLDFAAGTGLQLLPGTYNSATRYPFNAAGVNGLSVGNGTGCNTVTGSFVVLEAVYGPQGEVQRFHATFDQHCDGIAPALHGEIFIVADPWR